MPKVTLKLYTLFRQAAGTEQLVLELPPHSKVYDALESAAQKLGKDFRAFIWDRGSGQVLPSLVTVGGKVEPSSGGILHEKN